MFIIDGKKIADEKLLILREEVKKLSGTPKMSIVLVGESSASQIYVKNKMKAAAEVGIEAELIDLESNISEKELLNTIAKLNNEKSINGIIVQLPLPPHINQFSVIDSIDPTKDIDGFHPYNVGKLSILGLKSDGFISCTPLGCIDLIKSVTESVSGKNVTVVGKSNIVGKPISYILSHLNATVTLAHSKTINLDAITRNSDIVILATGNPKFFGEDYFNKDAIIIDIGISRMLDGQICGDVDFENVLQKVKAITPVPKGVGPMTIFHLINNTVIAFLLQVK